MHIYIYTHTPSDPLYKCQASQKSTSGESSSPSSTRRDAGAAALHGCVRRLVMDGKSNDADPVQKEQASYIYIYIIDRCIYIYTHIIGFRSVHT